MLPVMAENMLALEDSIVVDTAGNVLRRYKRTDKPVLKPFYSLYNFLANSNKMSDRNYDGGFVCGPSYNATTSFSVGGAYTALYSYDRKDSTLQKSVLSSFFNISIKGNAAVGLEGHNYMKRDKMRWNYELIFTHNPSRYWGVGYDNGCNPDRMIEFNQFMIDLIFDWKWKLAENLYVGPCVDVQYTNTFKHTVNNLNQTMGEMMLIDGLGDQPHAMLSSGVGVDMVYDSRDFAMNAYRGNYFRFLQMYYMPGVNKYSYWSTELDARHYQRVWKNCILAMQVHALLNYGMDVIPWTRMASVGRRGCLRGYYYGQYRDNNLLDAQMELRQKLTKRIGIVGWVGMGNLFHDFASFKWSKTLPNYGIGARWEFKPRMNIRLEYGFTRDGGSVVFNMGEAF